MIGGNVETLARAGNPPLWRPAAWEVMVPPAPARAAEPINKATLMGKSLAPPSGLEYPAAQLAALAGAGRKSLSPASASVRPVADNLNRLSLMGEIRLSAEPDRVVPMTLWTPDGTLNVTLSSATRY